jgi:hypothetical protein
MTEQTYLYYWHHDVWAVLGAWAVLILLLILVLLIGEELWRAGYETALRSVSVVNDAPRPAPPPVDEVNASIPEERHFLAPPSQAFPGIRAFFSGQRGERT